VQGLEEASFNDTIVEIEDVVDLSCPHDQLVQVLEEASFKDTISEIEDDVVDLSCPLACRLLGIESSSSREKIVKSDSKL
jgi:hypothetical protein